MTEEKRNKKEYIREIQRREWKNERRQKSTESITEKQSGRDKVNVKGFMWEIKEKQRTNERKKSKYKIKLTSLSEQGRKKNERIRKRRKKEKVEKGQRKESILIPTERKESEVEKTNINLKRETKVKKESERVRKLKYP